MFYSQIKVDKTHTTGDPVLVREGQAPLLSVPHVVHPGTPVTRFCRSNELKTHSLPTLNPGQIVLFWLGLLIPKELCA